MGHAAIRWGIVEERTRPAYAPRRSEVSVLTSFFASMQGVLDQAQGVLDQARMRQDPAWDASPASHTFIRKTRHARERALGPKTDILAGSCGGRGAHSGEAGVDGSGGGLLDDPAEDGKHGNAAVLKLSLAENLHVEHLGEAKGVEANVTGEGAVKVGGLLEEGDRLGEGALEHRHLGGGDRCTKQHAHVASADDCHLYKPYRRRNHLLKRMNRAVPRPSAPALREMYQHATIRLPLIPVNTLAVLHHAVCQPCRLNPADS